MRRTLVLALAALALLGVVASDALAQAPTPTFKISGLIDQVVTYTSNISGYDNNIARNQDKQWYGRTRGRFDFIGEVGKAKGVLGIELDHYWGQTGLGDSNGQGSTTCVTNTGSSVVCGTQGSGAEANFDLNTDVQSNLQIKWLYTEFEVPLIPVPTVMRLGGQPFGAAANYKLATYANGDFGGVNVVSTLTPNVKLLFTYVGVEELLTGKKDITATPLGVGTAGSTFPQSRGDDFAIILSAEVTPIKGLDIKPMYSYFFANGVTSSNARAPRGGFIITPSTAPNGTPAFSGTNTIPSQTPFAPASVAGADKVGTGINENRQTIGLDGRWRIGGFSLDPTVMYQFGHRDAYNTVTPAYGITCNATGNPATNCTKQKADINAWLLDVRAGYQIGPLLLQAAFNYTTGNSAKDSTLHNVNFFSPLDTDTSYMADWGNQITALGVDYYQILSTTGTNMGVSIGYDKYGRKQLGAKASYALTPSLTFGAGWTILWTDKSVDTDSIVVTNGGLLPSFVDRQTGRSAAPKGDSSLLGNEIDGTMTWRFAPGLALDVAAGYLFSGGALGHRTVALPYCDGGSQATASNGPCAIPNPKDYVINNVFITTARVRFTF